MEHNSLIKKYLSENYQNLFSLIIIFEKKLKQEFSEFIETKTGYGNLWTFLNNNHAFKKKAMPRIKQKFQKFSDPDWNKTDKGRKTLVYDFGYGEDWSTEAVIEGEVYFSLGSNVHELKVDSLVDILTFGELLELIMAFKTKTFFNYLKKQKKINFKYDSWIIFLVNVLKIRNRLFHGQNVGFKEFSEKVKYLRNHKISFLIKSIELFISNSVK